MEEIIQYLIEHIALGSKEFSLVMLSSMPIIELRGGVPVGILFFKLSVVKTYILCCFGNMLPVFPIVFLLGKAMKLMEKHKASHSFFKWYFEKVRKRTKVIERYEMWGLALFVSIPLPVTGAWTGSVAAFLLGIEPKKAIVSILCGVLIAGGIVTALTLGGYSCYEFLK